MAILALKLTSVFFYAIVSLVVLLFTKCIYNVYFHPLRHYPGPFIARATRLYHLYYDLSGTQHLAQKRWHDKYGDVVRVAPDELSYNTAQAWFDICGHRTRDRPASFDKDPGFYGLHKRSVQTNIVIANDEDHRRLRRLQSHAFSEKALLAQQDVIQGHINTFIAQLRKRALPATSATSAPDTEKTNNGVVDIVQWLNFLSFDTIGDLAFGSPFGCLVDGVDSRYINVIFSLIKIGNYLRAARRFPSPLNTLLMAAMVPKKLISERQYQVQVSREMVEKRLNSVTERPDFMSYILRANDENGMSHDEIKAGATIFLIAGSETTATLLSGALYLLLTHDEYRKRLTEEVRNAFKLESDIDMKSVLSLPFLQAVLQESLRLYPPAPNSFPRQTPAPGEIICGRFVPENTAVGIHQWSANRSSTNFNLPDEFIPERWMDVDDRFKNDKRDACQPFSYGPRNCIGQNLAYAEMRLTLTRLVWNFDIELHNDCRNWMQEQKTFTLWEKEPLRIQFRNVEH